MSKKKIDQLNGLKNELAKGTETLGALVYWRRLEGVRIRRADLRAGFEAIGLGKAVSKDPKPEACLNQACGLANRKSTIAEGTIKLELKSKGALGAAGSRATYAVLARRDLPDGRRRYMEEATVSIERGVRSPPPALRTDLSPGVQQDDGRDAVIAEVSTQYQDLLAYALTMEVSEALIAAMTELGALPLRTGVYFVPETHLLQARALQAFIQGETDIALTIWTIASGAENLAEAKRDAANAFAERFRTLREEVAAFVADLPKGEEPPTKSLNARVRHFRELDEQVGLYADILGDYQDELRAAIGAAKRELLGAYLGSESE